MTPRSLARALGAATLLLVLPGCLEMDVRLQDQGNGQVTIMLSMKKAIYEGAKKAAERRHGRNGSKAVGPDLDKVKKSGLKDPQTAEGETETDHWWKISGGFDDIHDLQFTEADAPFLVTFGFNRRYKYLYTDYSFTLHHEPKPGAVPDSPEERAQMSAILGGYQLKLKLTMPGSITDPADTTAYGDTATWDYDFDKVLTRGDSTIHARKWNLPLLGFGGLLIGAVGFLVWKRTSGGSRPQRQRRFVNPALMSPQMPAPAQALPPLDVPSSTPSAPVASAAPNAAAAPKTPASPKPTTQPTGPTVAAADLVRFPCPHCGVRLTSKRSLKGRPISCPKCRKSLSVP